jgi:hypothetical protein
MVALLGVVFRYVYNIAVADSVVNLFLYSSTKFIVLAQVPAT